MKKIIVSAIIATAILTSCKKECAYYMEGKKCETEVRIKYYGMYNGTLITGNTSKNEQVIVSSSNTGQEHFIIGDIKSTLTSKTSFDIPLQSYKNGSTTLYAEGNGYFNNNEITFTMIAESQGTNLAISYSGTK